MSTLQDALDDLLEDLEDSEDIVNSAPGTVAQPALTQLTLRLVSAELHCNVALTLLQVSGSPGQDENTYPSAPNLAAIAADCTMLAAYAQDEAIDHTTGWQHRCASHLVTVKRLITMDDGYRDRAGIT